MSITDIIKESRGRPDENRRLERALRDEVKQGPLKLYVADGPIPFGAKNIVVATCNDVILYPSLARPGEIYVLVSTSQTSIIRTQDFRGGNSLNVHYYSPGDISRGSRVYQGKLVNSFMEQGKRRLRHGKEVRTPFITEIHELTYQDYLRLRADHQSDAASYKIETQRLEQAKKQEIEAATQRIEAEYDAKLADLERPSDLGRKALEFVHDVNPKVIPLR